LKVFCCLIEKKVEPDDSIMEGMTMRPIDTEDLRTTGSLREIGDVVFGKLPPQVEKDRVELGLIAHVPIVDLSDVFRSMHHPGHFFRYTFSPTFSSRFGMVTFPSVEAMMVVFPEAEGPNSLDRSTLIVSVVPSTVISTFFMMVASR
jgi:hypothetical protein